MQQQEQAAPPPLTSSFINQLQSSITTDSSNSSIFDTNYHQKKFISSSRIKLGLRCSCPLDDKQQLLFDEIFPNNEQTTNISEHILDECIPRLIQNSSNILIILSGQHRDIHQLQSTVVSSTLTRLYNFVNENQEKDLNLRISVQEFLNSKKFGKKCLVSSDDYLVSSPNETCQYLNELCSNHRFNPLLITFHLINRLSNNNYALLHILLTNDNDNEIGKQQFSDIFMSLALSFSSNRQKQTLYTSTKRNLTTVQSLSSILNDYLSTNTEVYSKHFLYIFANVKNDKQVKYWSKLQRLFRIKKNRLKMSRDRFDSYADSSSVETITNRNNDEIWIDGPLSSTNSKTEIWIDGPPEFCSHSSKLLPVKLNFKHRSNSSRQYKSKPRSTFFSPKRPLLSSTLISQENNEVSSRNFDTESTVSSHCHLPVLPVFKDHSLLPFRSNQTLPRTKPLLTTEPTKIDLRLSTNKLNDDMEALEKTLETLLIPSPIVPNQTDTDQLSLTQSLNRIDQLSSSMSNDERAKRLSRIVSPTRFEKLFSHNQSIENFNWFHPPTPSSAGSSVPNSPVIISKNRQVRTPLNSTPETPRRSILQSKKSKILSDTNRPTTNTRPSIFQRLFGLRSSSNSQQQQQQPISIVIDSPPSTPLISPLRVTLDSHDDLMPLTTSSTASSASGRASSSGYESMSNTALEEMIASIPIIMTNDNNPVKLRNKSIRKEERRPNINALWSSPVLRDKSHRQQRISQLKHRQNELKIELAMTKTFLLMDKNKTLDYNDSFNSTLSNSPMHTIMSNMNEEDELERDIEYLERRLLSTKTQLMFVTYQKNKQLKS
ncbi:unnamed protein product [Adineta steineri]|uniref:Uncharacterized protein n=1 Tax=Adineta steineri TaxID=433720 RepID=A0A814XE75_9BILA|nr:unnamed protein product [Adineta steineri]CAF3607275.1 unnamed protein product [Adineta steineri]